MLLRTAVPVTDGEIADLLQLIDEDFGELRYRLEQFRERLEDVRARHAQYQQDVATAIEREEIAQLNRAFAGEAPSSFNIRPSTSTGG